jgi:hypothetical protein
VSVNGYTLEQYECSGRFRPRKGEAIPGPAATRSPLRADDEIRFLSKGSVVELDVAMSLVEGDGQQPLEDLPPQPARQIDFDVTAREPE